MLAEGLFVAIYLVHAAVSFWSLGRIRAFLSETPAMTDPVALRRYKELVRVQMYLALLVIGLLIPGLVTAWIIIRRHGVTGLVPVLAVNAALYALGRKHKQWEEKARNLAVSDALLLEYHRVSEVWVKKPLPDF